MFELHPVTSRSVFLCTSEKYFSFDPSFKVVKVNTGRKPSPLSSHQLLIKVRVHHTIQKLHSLKIYCDVCILLNYSDTSPQKSSLQTSYTCWLTEGSSALHTLHPHSCCPVHTTQPEHENLFPPDGHMTLCLLSISWQPQLVTGLSSRK